MKILITGASGLIGSAIYEDLSSDYQIVGFQGKPISNQFITCNLLSNDAHSKIKSINPDVIIHAAAITPSSSIESIEKVTRVIRAVHPDFN